VHSAKLKKYIGRTLLYLVLILAAVYTLAPFITIIMTSLRTQRDVLRGPFSPPTDWAIVENYVQAWTIGRFDQYFLNSIVMLVITVAGTLLVCTLASYSFAKFRYPGRKALYYTLLLGMMIPFQTVMLPLYFVLKAFGMLNSVPGIGFLGVATGLGFGIMMMRSFFVSLPDTLLEAARLDGCNELRVLTRVVLPNTFPAWSSLTVFTAMGSWNNLLAPMLYIFDEAKYPIPYALYAFRGSHSTDYALLSAAMVISIVPIIIIYLIFQSKFQTNLMAGAIKG